MSTKKIICSEMKRTKKVFILLIIFLLFQSTHGLEERDPNCDFAAVLSKEGFFLANITDNQIHPVFPVKEITYTQKLRQAAHL